MQKVQILRLDSPVGSGIQIEDIPLDALMVVRCHDDRLWLMRRTSARMDRTFWSRVGGSLRDERFSTDARPVFEVSENCRHIHGFDEFTETAFLVETTRVRDLVLSWLKAATSLLWLLSSRGKMSFEEAISASSQAGSLDLWPGFPIRIRSQVNPLTYEHHVSVDALGVSVSAKCIDEYAAVIAIGREFLCDEMDARLGDCDTIKTCMTRSEGMLR